jgi:sugar/nucleoside kinase (ribokinase family)
MSSSKKYHVYGLGNALVDMEYETTDEELQKLGIEKGVMTLIDEDRQGDLLEKMWRKPKKRAAGGSAANTVIGLAQLGGRSFYSCKIGDDETGHFYLADLKENGVDSNVDPSRLEKGTTGKCLVMVTPDAERTMNTFLGITSGLGPNELDEAAVADSEYLYIEGYLAPSPAALEAARRATAITRDAGGKVALTLSDPSMAEHFRVQLNEVIDAGVDLLFCNETEAMKISQTETLEEAKEFIRSKAPTFVITMGAQGAFVFDGRDGKQVEGFESKAVDTNGAGDLFAGSFLYGINHGMDYFESARLANRAAAKLIQEYGPRLEPADLQKVLADHRAQ